MCNNGHYLLLLRESKGNKDNMEFGLFENKSSLSISQSDLSYFCNLSIYSQGIAGIYLTLEAG